MLKVYENIDKTSSKILEDILGWDIPFRNFKNDVNASIPLFSAANLNMVEDELVRSEKVHHLRNTHLHLFGMLKRSCSNDISGIQNVQPYSPENKIILVHEKPHLRYSVMHRNDFFGQSSITY